MTMAYRRKARHFNPRSPRGERLLICFVVPAVRIFQSTLPAGGATASEAALNRQWQISIHAPRGGSDQQANKERGKPLHFNPRSPRGERHGYVLGLACVRTISIHAPRGGSDDRLLLHTVAWWRFQSTLPAGGATGKIRVAAYRHQNFNPRSPRGERQQRLPKACGKLVQVPVNVKGTVR